MGGVGKKREVGRCTDSFSVGRGQLSNPTAAPARRWRGVPSVCGSLGFPAVAGWRPPSTRGFASSVAGRSAISVAIAIRAWNWMAIACPTTRCEAGPDDPGHSLSMACTSACGIRTRKSGGYVEWVYRGCTSMQVHACHPCIVAFLYVYHTKICGTIPQLVSLTHWR